MLVGPLEDWAVETPWPMKQLAAASVEETRDRSLILAVAEQCENWWWVCVCG
jgi:hypothetical protein